MPMHAPIAPRTTRQYPMAPGYGNYSSQDRIMDEKSRYFSSFQPHAKHHVKWYMDSGHQLSWPGTERIQAGKTYEAIINYFFTPNCACVLFVRERIEACITMEDMDCDIQANSLKEILKLYHLIHVKLKEPIDFDEKGRPKVVISQNDNVPLPRLVKFQRISCTPIFALKNTVIFQLENESILGQMFTREMGFRKFNPLLYPMDIFFKKDDKVQLEIVKPPRMPTQCGYLLRVPFVSEVRDKWCIEFPELEECIRFRGGPSDDVSDIIAKTKAPQEESNLIVKHTTNQLEDILPTESRPCTIAAFSRRIGGKLKDVLRYIFLKTKVPIASSKQITINIAKRIYNFVTGRCEFVDIDEKLEKTELDQLVKTSLDAKYATRPISPVVVLLGHVNHGKTSLFDLVCNTNFGSTEPGLVTQHVRASQVQDGPFCLIDTPGHHAFDFMRQNASRAADLAIVVVAANEGIMDQTRSSLLLCKELKIPFIIATTKNDLDNLKTEEIATELANLDILIEPLGGDVQFLSLSTRTDSVQSRQALIDAINLQHAVSAPEPVQMPADHLANGIVLEAGRDKRYGQYAMLLVKNKTLSCGNYIVSGSTATRVAMLKDVNGNVVKSLGASNVAILVSQGSFTPGNDFVALKSEDLAMVLARETSTQEKVTRTTRAYQEHVMASLDDTCSDLVQDESIKHVPVFIKSDVESGLDAVQQALEPLEALGMTRRCKFQFLGASTGQVTLSDVALVASQRGCLCCFNVPINAAAKTEARRLSVNVLSAKVIYNLVQSAEKFLQASLDEPLLGNIVGTFKVLKVFQAAKRNTAAGGVVVKGQIHAGAQVRILRNGTVIYSVRCNIPRRFQGTIASLRRTTEAALVVNESESCGMTFKDFNKVQPDDLVEAFAPAEQIAPGDIQS
ncbi:bifunctional Translation initiation factor IF- 2/P-loop containing nucleoside triphosphate hydrolase/Translation initiation factor IF-2 [Babesia duncani]|uniref:Bifunctional Translation initiation factor IF-2/P-loop containing nucleoside triphosphate hydrolase/Translation initiation factor IF-2 n=1 Tax=Babesia duncani TaxID=323732 RepID=A0AAD9UQV7_9APIC|nr:bifunctional Translation initiation factor IF- 2/P-loop containing nucleoside triphosphate hydrolase/Translation initiation factor IF-2 [Babesia duncani]